MTLLRGTNTRLAMTSRKIICFTCVVLAGLGVACKETTKVGKDGATVNVSAEIEGLSRDLGLKIPITARILGVKRERGIDDAVFAKFEMSRAEWEALKFAAPLTGADFDKASKAYLPTDEGWWDPNHAEGVRAAQIELEGGRVLDVGIDDTRDRDLVVVYLVNHGT